MASVQLDGREMGLWDTACGKRFVSSPRARIDGRTFTRIRNDIILYQWRLYQSLERQIRWSAYNFPTTPTVSIAEFDLRHLAAIGVGSLWLGLTTDNTVVSDILIERRKKTIHITDPIPRAEKKHTPEHAKRQRRTQVGVSGVRNPSEMSEKI